MHVVVMRINALIILTIFNVANDLQMSKLIRNLQGMPKRLIFSALLFTDESPNTEIAFNEAIREINFNDKVHVSTN